MSACLKGAMNRLEAMSTPWIKCGNRTLARNATDCSHDLFCTAHLSVIAADNPFDLSSWTTSIVREQNLIFTHRSHGRLLLHGCSECRTGNAHWEKSGNEAYRLDHFPLLQL